jgi:hypothetical protein
MIEAEILQKMRAASIEDRIAIIEWLLQSLKAELNPSLETQPPTDGNYAIRRTFNQPLAGFSDSAYEGLLRSIVRRYAELDTSEDRPQRPAFGFMKDTGTILGDIVAPVIPESDWEVLR